MKIEAGLRVVCVDGYCNEEYRATVIDMVERGGLNFAIVSIDGSNQLLAELTTCLVAESEFESGDF